MSLLTLNNIAYRYEGSRKMIFRDLNMSFEPGKVYTIVGKSGSGKSTLLSLLAGLDICIQGTITFGGKNLRELNLDRYRARSVGVVFQSYNLMTTATAIDNMLLSMHISGVKEKNMKAGAYTLLEKLGIDKEKADRKVLKLSGGEQQRVAIARAISHNPDAILADEPTGNLDRETEAAILTIFDRLAHEDGKCVIIVAHSKKVTAIADEIWGMEKGVLTHVK
jgi:putative ABC transport system ATP-binding protein